MAKVSINLKDGTVDKQEEKDIIIGIDLGTTNSLVAYIDDGIPKTITGPNGSSSLVPSVVHFLDDEQVIVGESAKSLLVEKPGNTIYSVKRLLGKSYADLTDLGVQLGYKIIDNEDGGLVKIQVGARFYSPIELSSEILKELKRMAEMHLETTVSRAVITVPAYFNDGQRQATRDAGKLAGLDVLRIVNEPTAASLAYDIGTSRDDKETIVVYDLGGGTFDISILDIEEGVFEVLATNGDTFLGGDDFDQAIIEYWIASYQISQKLLLNKNFMQSLRLKAEEAKKYLSNHDIYESSLEGIEITLSLMIFEDLIRPLILTTIELCSKCIADSGKKLEEFDEVIMVGGSTRTPLVKKMVSAYFNKKVNDHLDPDQVVALGAAVQADILAGNRKDMLLLDITPLSLGIETIGGLMDTIIPRNSKVPSRAGRQYTTSVDGQSNLKVAVYQGERDLVQDNRKLGEFILKGIPPMSAGMPKIDIQFILDADGILRVRAKEERSNVETEVEIKSQYGISEEDMAKMLIASLQNAQADREVRGLIEAQTEAQNVILHSTKFVRQNKELLAADEIHELERLVNLLENEKNEGSKDSINLAMENLNHYSRPIAERVMDYNIANALKGKVV